LDFDKLDWARYISEEKLLEAVPEIYGCDPRDETAYRAMEKAIADDVSQRATGKSGGEELSEGSLAAKLANCAVI
jgi:hypothetical protein